MVNFWSVLLCSFTMGDRGSISFNLPEMLDLMLDKTQFRLVLLAYKILDEVTSLLVYFQSFIRCMPE